VRARKGYFATQASGTASTPGGQQNPE
jgi:hypothetical protein